MEGFIENIEQKTLENENYRTVVYTGPDSQLALMTLQPGEEIGEEAHEEDQFIRVEQGSGEAILNGVAHHIEDAYALIVPKGAMHNIKNTGSIPLKLYTLYTAPEHPEGTVHKTKADSVAEEGH